MATRTISQQIDLTNQAEPVNRYITKIDSEGIKIHPEDQSNNDYIQLDGNGLKVYKNNINVASFMASGAQIGLLSGAHSIIDSNGQRFYGSNGTTQLANIGYGEVATAGGGTAIAPFFSFGTRRVYTHKPIGSYSFVEGVDGCAYGEAAHVEGSGNYASNFSHAEGLSTSADGGADHAEGVGTASSGNAAHAEGRYTEAAGANSHAQNLNTIAGYDSQTAIGKFNDNNSLNAFEIGNGEEGHGSTPAVRSNAFTVAWTGDVEAAGDITDGNGNVLSDKADTSAIPTATSDLTNDSHFVDLTSSKPLFKKVSVQKTFSISAGSTANQSFAPASADVPSGYTRVGLCSWNTANGNVFIVTCTGTTITFGNKSNSSVTCTNAQVDWLYIRSSV